MLAIPRILRKFSSEIELSIYPILSIRILILRFLLFAVLIAFARLEENAVILNWSCLPTFREACNKIFHWILRRTCQPCSREARRSKTRNWDRGISLFLEHTYHRGIRLFPDSSFDPPPNPRSLPDRSSSLASFNVVCMHCVVCDMLKTNLACLFEVQSSFL